MSSWNIEQDAALVQADATTTARRRKTKTPVGLAPLGGITPLAGNPYASAKLTPLDPVSERYVEEVDQRLAEFSLLGGDKQKQFVQDAIVLFCEHGAQTFDFLSVFLGEFKLGAADKLGSIEHQAMLRDNQIDIGRHLADTKLARLLDEHILGAGNILVAVTALVKLQVALPSTVVRALVSVDGRDNARYVNDAVRNQTLGGLLVQARNRPAVTAALERLNVALNEWYVNGSQISLHLATTRKRLKIEVVTPLFYTHLHQVVVMAAHVLNDEFDRALVLRRAYIRHIAEIGRTLASTRSNKRVLLGIAPSSPAK